MKKSKERIVRVKASVLAVAMLLSIMMPVGIALGAEEEISEPPPIDTQVCREDSGKASEGDTSNTIPSDSGNGAAVLENSGENANSKTDGNSEIISIVENEEAISKSSSNGKLKTENDFNINNNFNNGIVDGSKNSTCEEGCICDDCSKEEKSDSPSSNSTTVIRETITKEEYDAFTGKQTANNSSGQVAPGVMWTSCSKDGWYIVSDETAETGEIQVAYKIGPNYFIVTFFIDGPGRHRIGDGSGEQGVNHVMIGDFGSGEGSDNPVVCDFCKKAHCECPILCIDCGKSSCECSTLCSDCQKNPCDCPTVNPACGDCGFSPCECPVAKSVCGDCGRNPCTCPPPANDGSVDPESNSAAGTSEAGSTSTEESSGTEEQSVATAAGSEDNAASEASREARAATPPSATPKTGDPKGWNQIAMMLSAIVVVLSAAGLGLTRPEES